MPGREDANEWKTDSRGRYRRCKSEPRKIKQGHCWLWKADDQPWVFNLGTQEGKMGRQRTISRFREQ